MQVKIYGQPSIDELYDSERKIFYQTIYSRLKELAEK